MPRNRRALTLLTLVCGLVSAGELFTSTAAAELTPVQVKRFINPNYALVPAAPEIAPAPVALQRQVAGGGQVMNPALLKGLPAVTPVANAGVDPVGACCMLDGTCQEITAADCNASSGVYYGDNTLCKDAPCGIDGQCCVQEKNGDIQCFVSNVATCFVQLHGYVFSWPGDCQSECPPLGACCLEQNECFVTLDWVCEIYNGEWLGPDTSCDDCGKVQPGVGACCIDFKCSILTQTDCAFAGGTYYGDDTVCRDIDCFDDPQAGACCLPDETCMFTTESICENHKGTFNGVDTLCSEVNCDLLGACCMIDGTCLELTEQECLNTGYLFNGVGTFCKDVECIAPTGSCCVPYDHCKVVTINECFGVLGGFVWSTPGDCSTPCPVGGSCCLNGSCFIQGQEICEVWFGGTYHGDFTACNDNDGDGTPDPCDTCIADISPQGGDGVVNVNDLLEVINHWGPCSPPPASCVGNIEPPGGDGTVNVNDLLTIINSWGPC